MSPAATDITRTREEAERILRERYTWITNGQDGIAAEMATLHIDFAAQVPGSTVDWNGIALRFVGPTRLTVKAGETDEPRIGDDS